MRHLRSLTFATALAATALTTALAPTPANAAIIDAGVELGAVKRELSGRKYSVGFGYQLHASFALLPPFLQIGPYLTMSNSQPETPTGADSKPPSIDFRTIGLRAKLNIPVPGPVTPYGIAGIGWVHGNFPDYSFKLCPPAVPPLPALPCYEQKVPNADANFVELVLGAGLKIDLAGPVVLTLEGNWRPSFGYTNDAYEQAANGQVAAATGGSTTSSAPKPGRTGYALTGMIGLAISI